MKRLSILQVFSRYLHYGGEEGMVKVLNRTLSEFHHIEDFSIATEEILGKGVLSKALFPFLAFHNPDAIKRLKLRQEAERFAFWQIHNVFPAISPAAYSLAFKMDVPVIHYLHNYKFGCPNGFMFVDGKENRDCINGNFWPAIWQKSWHDSYIKTAVMAAVLAHTRQMGVFKKVSRWIAISHAQKAICVEMGIPAEKIDVIHHFYDTPPKISPRAPKDGYALFIGRLSAEKGVGHLLEAWKSVPNHRQLVIAGDGPLLGELQMKASASGLTNVRFPGFVPKDQQQELWAGAAFSVVPSIWQEPFGMVVLEAWAHQRPVVAHQIGALPEIVTDGVNGFLANPDDPDHLAKALEHAFLATSEELGKMGQNGREALDGHYSKKRWLRDIHRTYAAAGIL